MGPRGRTGDHDEVIAAKGRTTRSRPDTAGQAQRPERCASTARSRCRNEVCTRAAGESALGAALVIDGGEHVAVGPHVAKRRKHALGTPEIEQEVVHQRDARRGAERCRPVSQWATVFLSSMTVAPAQRRSTRWRPNASRLACRVRGVAVVRQLFRRIWWRRTGAARLRACARRRAAAGVLRRDRLRPRPSGPRGSTWSSLAAATRSIVRASVHELAPAGAPARRGCVAHRARGLRAGTGVGAGRGRRLGDAVGDRVSATARAVPGRDRTTTTCSGAAGRGGGPPGGGGRRS